MIEINEALLSKANKGDKQSKEEIIKTFQTTIQNLTKRFRFDQLESSDLAQEGYLGLNRAIDAYCCEKGSFVPFAIKCIENAMINYVKKHTNEKRKHSLDNSEIEEGTIGGETSLIADSPESLIIIQEDNERLKKIINDELTDLEKETIELFLEGYDYKEIAIIIKKDTKAVDNAMARARKKLVKILKEG